MKFNYISDIIIYQYVI